MQDLLNRVVLAFKLMRSDERGATAVEYGLMIAMIAAIVVAGAQALGVNVLGAFNDMVGCMDGTC